MMTVTSRPDLFGKAAQEFDRAFSGDGAPRPFVEERQTARDHFTALGLPTRKLEAWKYTDLRSALREDYAFLHGTGISTLTSDEVDRYAIPGLDAARLVLVNGAVVPGLSRLGAMPEGVTVQSLREAAEAGEAIVHSHLGQFTETEDDAFAALNAAFDLDGVFVHVPKNTEAETPLHVIHLVEHDGPAFVQTRHLIVAEANARVRIIESYVSLDGAAPQFGNHLTEIAAGPGANVRHVRIQDEGDTAHQVTTLKAHQMVAELWCGSVQRD
ncbi:MAG: SufD family Fe-S cluster assembly protein, partial [Bacteroidota bacterium]